MKKKKRRIDLSERDLNPLNTDLLRRFTSGEGKAAKILPHYVHGLPSNLQKKLAKTIKIARQLNLM
ncbi:MAG: bS18 family ribosomal protein [Candidatus Caenarcaniphilales bacterium]|nr:bS18 family ribosomal protein [Candidatus Caenarcaniphilales bacterium]